MDNRGSQIRVYSEAEQRRLLENHIRRGVWRSISLIHRKHVEIEGLAITRAMGVGLQDYGDRLFHLSREEIDTEAMDEAADLAVYEAVYDMRENGVIP